MQIESHAKLGRPEKRPATRVVVYDDFGNPIGVFIQVTPTNVYMSYKGHKDFESALAGLGIRDTTILTVVKSADLPPLRVE